MTIEESVNSLKKVHTLEQFSKLSPFQMEILMTSTERPDIPVTNLMKAYITGRLELIVNSQSFNTSKLERRRAELLSDNLNSGNKGFENAALDNAIIAENNLNVQLTAQREGIEIEGNKALIDRYTQERDAWLGIAVEIEQSPVDASTVLKRD